MIRNLIFDIDGTLWDSTEVVARGWRQAVAETGYSHAEVTADILRHEFGQPMDVIADHVFRDVNDREKRGELLARCCEYEHQLLDENTEDISYPGVREGMEKLAGHYRLYIVSNCQCGYIELVMKKTGIGHLISDFECFGNTGTCKGETIRTLMERNGILPEETVYIGDTRGDYEASALAGISFILASYGFGEVPEADVRIEEFAGLERAVGEITQGQAIS